jgi:hypothetical protein
VVDILRKFAGGFVVVWKPIVNGIKAVDGRWLNAVDEEIRPARVESWTARRKNGGVG